MPHLVTARLALLAVVGVSVGSLLEACGSSSSPVAAFGPTTPAVVNPTVPAPTVGGLTLTVTGLPGAMAASVVVTGASGFAQTLSGTAALTSLAPGGYTVTAGTVADAGSTYAPTPASQLLTVAAGATVTGSIAYALVPPTPAPTPAPTPNPVGALTVTVTGLPAGTPAAITITGAGGFSSTLGATGTLAGLAPGAYTVAAASVASGATTYAPQPASQSVTVTSGATAAATVAYAAVPSTFGALSPGFRAGSFVIDGVRHDYQLFIPVGYTPTRSTPVILSMHGSEAKGSNNTAQLGEGLGLYVSQHATTFPAVVVLPQLPTTNDGRSGLDAALWQQRFFMAALEQALTVVNADRTRLYVQGISIGGCIVWPLLYRYPTMWAAGIAISAKVFGPTLTGDATTTDDQGRALVASTLATMPIRVFHGEADATFLPAENRDLNLKFRGPTATFRYTEYRSTSHAGAWLTAFEDPATWTWLFDQHR